MSASDTLIGRYKVLRPLGVGGMAEVLLVELATQDARDPARRDDLRGAARRFALKRVLPGHPAEAQLTESFRDEGQLLMKLWHPNIVYGFDVGMHEGRAFLVMEFVDGVDLKQVLRFLRRSKRRMPTDVALLVAAQICAALDYARREPFGVIHRDISPNNVLLGFYGQVKLVDFGIARAATHEHRTETGVMKGKVAYMSPEQIDEKLGLDHRSDIFSLGTLLYEMLSGVHPFKGERRDDVQLLRAIRYDGHFTPLDLIVPDLPPGLAPLVHSMLAHDKENRPASADVAGRSLESFLRDGSVGRRLAELVQEVCDQAPPQTGPNPKPPSAAANQATAGAKSRLPATPPPGFVAAKAPELLSEDEEDLLEESGELDLDGIHYEPTGTTVDRTTPSPRAASPVLAVAPQTRLADSPAKEPSTPPLAPARRTKPIVIGLLALLALALFLVIAASQRDKLATPEAGWTARTGEPLARAQPSPASIPDELARAFRPLPTALPDSDASTAPAPPAASPPNDSPTRAESTPGAHRTISSEAKSKTATLRLTIKPWGEGWLDGVSIGLAEQDITGLKPGRPYKLKVRQGAHTINKLLRLTPGLNEVTIQLP